MRLLICTQAIDLDDPILGFFHRWVVEIASRFENVVVICLRAGNYNLPDNVRVISLGKEEGHSRGVYIARFFHAIWRFRKDYDAVFVHMNQEYVLLGLFFWKLQKKTIYLWRNHYEGSIFTNLAVSACRKVFCTSRFSYTARFKRTVLMPVGVDTEAFQAVPGVVRTPRSILSLGRISPSKQLDMLLDALQILAERGVRFQCDIYGGATVGDESYLEQLKQRAGKSLFRDSTVFYGPVKNIDTPSIYSSHCLFVNLSPNGMFDKTLFEAAACGCVVIAASEDFASLTKLVPAVDARICADQIESALAFDHQARMRDIAESNSLKRLGERLAVEMQS